MLQPLHSVIIDIVEYFCELAAKGGRNVLKEISALKARQNLGEILEEVYYQNDHVIIKRRDKAMAVMIPVEEYEAWLAQRERDFKVFDEIRAKNRGISEARLTRDLEAVERRLRAGGRAAR